MEPGNTRTNGIWIERLLPLMDEPGTWFAVFSSPKLKGAENQAYALRSGRVKTPPGEWEFVSRWYPEEGLSRTFARYMGDEPAVTTHQPALGRRPKAVPKAPVTESVVEVQPSRSLFQNPEYEADVAAQFEEKPLVVEVESEAVVQVLEVLQDEVGEPLEPLAEDHYPEGSVSLEEPKENNSILGNTITASKIVEGVVTAEHFAPVEREVDLEIPEENEKVMFSEGDFVDDDEEDPGTVVIAE